MYLMDSNIIIAGFGLVGIMISSAVTYSVTKINLRRNIQQSRESYVDEKLREIINIYETELTSLREEVRNSINENLTLGKAIRELIGENIKLREDIVELKQKIKENMECMECELKKSKCKEETS
jgi:hypothetical protein